MKKSLKISLIILVIASLTFSLVISSLRINDLERKLSTIESDLEDLSDYAGDLEIRIEELESFTEEIYVNVN